MISGGVCNVARWVAPPARIEAPAKLLGRKRRSRVTGMKKDRVGIRPFDVNHKGEEAGKRKSREER